MKQIDEYSYQCGVMDCFSEMVKAELKRIALSHPSSTKEIRDQYIPFAENICDKYQIHFYLDDDPLITDLFPASMNKNTYNIIFYKDENDIEEYKTLKELKFKVIENQEYENYRYEIAYRFGKLLSYSDETIQNYIQNNDEKE